MASYGAVRTHRLQFRVLLAQGRQVVHVQLYGPPRMFVVLHFDGLAQTLVKLTSVAFVTTLLWTKCRGGILRMTGSVVEAFQRACAVVTREPAL